MKTFTFTVILAASAFLLTSCMVASLVTAPVRLAGDIVEGTYNTGKAIVTMGSDDDAEESE